MSEHTITCVIPAYNSGGDLLRTLDSLAGQSSPAEEVIVVDDGSSDDSADRAEAHPSKPRVVRQPNSGAAIARYRGVEAATGDLVVFTDAGDDSDPERLEIFRECFRRYPEAAAATARVRFEGTETLSKWYGREGADFDLIQDPLGQMLGQSWPVAIAMNFAVRREVAVKACKVPAFFRAANDYAMQIQCAEHGPFAIASRPTVLYEMTSGGISQRHGLAKQTAFALVAAAQAKRRCREPRPAYESIFRERVREDVGAAIMESVIKREWGLVRSLLSIAGPAIFDPIVLRRGWWHLQRRQLPAGHLADPSYEVPDTRRSNETR